MSKLAINGGSKIRTKLFPAYKVMGEEEVEAASRVIRSGILSRYLGSWHDDFYGGPEVQAFEKEWANFFKVKHAIAVNSATSGLYCAVGAADIGPGDEVIVTPYSMSASAIAPIIYNAIPVFADIEEDYFCLDPDSIEERITKYTKAIIVVDILGQPYDADRINAIAKKHNLIVIEDNAQAPMAKFRDKYAGTLGDMGIFSLNYHKHIHTGEGSLIVTDNDELAEKLRMIRNHAEAVLDERGFAPLINMLGFNYRLTEIQAAIGREQLKKLPKLIEDRVKNVEYLTKKLSAIPCIEPAKTRPNATHVYYTHPLKYHEETCGIPRNTFVEAVRAELPGTELRETEGVIINLCSGPLYMQTLYQKRLAYNKGCPWSCPEYKGNVNYDQGLCPTREKIADILINHELMRPPMTTDDLDDVIKAFEKVWENRKELENKVEVLKAI